ncbi:hypothetical protein PT2222_90230 [Paraburkholderia tropica]
MSDGKAGRALSASQGAGCGRKVQDFTIRAGADRRCGASGAHSEAHQHHQLEILAVRGLERDLVVSDAAVARMMEFAPSAFALEHVLRAPVAAEFVARGDQRIDQRARGRVVQMADGVGAELSGQTARAGFPVDDQLASERLREGETQQVAVVIAVEPAREQIRGLRVPGERGPLAVEHVGGRVDQADGLQQGGGRVGGAGGVGFGGIALRGEFEQIGAFGAREPQRHGDARERVRRRRDRPALLDPRVPGRTHAAKLRDFLAAQAGRAPARAGRQADFLRRQTLAMGADELAERARGRGVEGFSGAGIAGSGGIEAHGRLAGAGDTRIIAQLVLVQNGLYCNG